MTAIFLSARDLKRARFINKVVEAEYKHAERAYGLRTVIESKRQDIPLSWLLAMIEQETGWANVFGCDHGEGKAFCHQRVTNAKVKQLLAQSLYNGVGYTQLTSRAYVEDAMRRRGGAVSVRNQIIVGAKVFKEKTGGNMNLAWRYNGAPAYQDQIAPKAKRWHRRFEKADLA